MADAIKSELGVETTLIRGGGGIFDVHVDQELIYSKHQSGGFPEHQTILDRLATRSS